MPKVRLTVSGHFCPRYGDVIDILFPNVHPFDTLKTQMHQPIYMFNGLSNA